MVDKQRYISLTREHSSLRLFANPDWLDVISGNWSVHTVTTGDEVVMIPYDISRKSIFLRYGTPRGCPWTEVLTYNESRSDAVLPLKNLNPAFLDDLSGANLYTFSFPYDCSLGLNQRSTFSVDVVSTQVLDLDLPISEVFRGFSTSLRKNLRRNERILDFESQENKIARFLALNRNTNIRAGREIYDPVFLEHLASNSIRRGFGDIFLASDGKRDLAAVFVLWDSEVLYIHSSGINEETRIRGAFQSLLWFCIGKFSKKVKRLDFCGSDVQGIQEHNMSFGSSMKRRFILQKWYPAFLGKARKLLLSH